MKTIILETSTEKGCIVLAEESQVIDFVFLSGGPELSKKLALETSLLLKKHSFLPLRIAVGLGPGSFTGVRVGAALAKSLAFGWQIPLTGFCSLKAFLPHKKDPISSAIVFDARMGGAYVLTSEDDTPRLIPPNILEKHLSGIEKIQSPHPELLKKRFSFSCEEVNLDPINLVLLVKQTFLERKSTPLHIEYLSSP